jgi:hypothetical protein
MKKLFFLILYFITSSSFADCKGPQDLLVLGDSQTGATWSRSYFGNFLQQCLNGNFVILGKGGSNPKTWYAGGLENIEIVKRDPINSHINLGPESTLPLCQKRLPEMIDAYNPRKILFFFGDNMIASPDEQIKKEIVGLLEIILKKNIPRENCFFLTPSFEMEVKTKRNVSRKNLPNTERIRDIIANTILNKCQHIDGLEIMRNSPYFDGKELLRRVLIQGKAGCGGAAENDNIHLCGEAAKDLAEKVCAILRL